MAEIPTIFTLPGLEASRFAGQRVITVSSPAAATDFSLTVPGGRAWLLQAVRFQVATDSNVANRQAILTISSTGLEVIRVAAPGVQTASETIIYSFAPNLEGVDGGATMTSPLPGSLMLLPGDAIGSAVAAMEAGDQISAIRFFIHEFYYPQ